MVDFNFYVPNLCVCFIEIANCRGSETFNVFDVSSVVFNFIIALFYSSDQTKDHLVPEWAQQEVGLCPLTKGVLESWFPQSDQSGVSSHLMESMR